MPGSPDRDAWKEERPAVSDTTCWITSILFTLTYVGLALGKVPWLRMDRAGIALIGATLMLVTGMLTLEQAVSTESIDYRTLVLLFGMMIVVAFLRLSGFFRQLAGWALHRIHTPRGLLALTILLSGVLSAFLINDVVCVALTPLVLTWPAGCASTRCRTSLPSPRRPTSVRQGPSPATRRTSTSVRIPAFRTSALRRSSSPSVRSVWC
jgi:hypothetical protein